MVSDASRAALTMTTSTALLFAFVCCCGAVGCRSTPPSREELLEAYSAEVSALELTLASQDQPEPGVLRFALAFEGEADLDLFVTGPLFETVYFANTASKTGGALVADLRCGSPAPRLENIRYPDPLPGTYRVGIDFPKRCDEARGAVPFAVRVERGGEPSLATTRGMIHPGEFLTIVLETEIR